MPSTDNATEMVLSSFNWADEEAAQAAPAAWSVRPRAE